MHREACFSSMASAILVLTSGLVVPKLLLAVFLLAVFLLAVFLLAVFLLAIFLFLFLFLFLFAIAAPISLSQLPLSPRLLLHALQQQQPSGNGNPNSGGIMATNRQFWAVPLCSVTHLPIRETYSSMSSPNPKLGTAEVEEACGRQSV